MALTVLIDVNKDSADDRAVIEAEKQCLVQELVPGAMKCQATPFSSLQASMAFEVNSVPSLITAAREGIAK